MEKQHNEQDDRMNVITRDEESPASNTTTGSGLSEAERSFEDGTNSDVAHDGSQVLVDMYNINDKANSDSSLDDFITTTSNYHHAEQPDDSPENDGRH